MTKTRKTSAGRSTQNGKQLVAGCQVPQIGPDSGIVKVLRGIGGDVERDDFIAILPQLLPLFGHHRTT